MPQTDLVHCCGACLAGSVDSRKACTECGPRLRVGWWVSEGNGHLGHGWYAGAYASTSRQTNSWNAPITGEPFGSEDRAETIGQVMAHYVLSRIREGVAPPDITEEEVAQAIGGSE